MAQGDDVRAKYFYGYNIVAAGFAIQAVSIGAMFAYGVFFKEFQVEFGWSRATISGASSLAFFVMGAVGILVGRLNDRIGPRILIAAAGSFLGIGYLLLSYMQSPWQLYMLYGLMVGVGYSTHDVITLSTIARWFVKRRGMMSGIVKVGTGCGQLCVPLIATALIAAFGWRYSCFIIGATALAALVTVAQVMRRDPERAGLLPDNGYDVPAGTVITVDEGGLSLREASRTKQFWTLCVAEFAVFFCLLTIVVHIVPHARDLGLPPATAAAVIATIGGVSMLGRFTMGTVNDGIGGKRSLITCFIILICGLVWLQLSQGAWMLFLFAIIYGFAHGGLFTVMSPMVAELFGTGSHGLLFGIVLFSGDIGGSIGPLLAGHIFDLTGSYRLVFLILIALAVVGFILITTLRPPAKDVGAT
jgi:MFS transporter, OFA family, oxalate/formate antiporter